MAQQRSRCTHALELHALNGISLPLTTIKKFEPVIIFENWISQSQEKTLAPFLELRRMSLGYEFFIIEMREKSQFTFAPSFIELDIDRRKSYEDRLNVVAWPSKRFGLPLPNL
jgi:hypothetical protein